MPNLEKKKTITRAAILWWAASVTLVSSSALAVVPAYILDSSQSSLTFTATQNNAPVKGSFKKFDADIEFTPDMLGNSHITVNIAIGSVSMDDMEIADTLKSAEWLSAEAFPNAEFKSTEITIDSGADNYLAKGILTLKQHAVPLTLHFHMNHQDSLGAEATGYGMLKRKDFTVGEGQWANDESVKNDVRIDFHVVAKKK